MAGGDGWGGKIIGLADMITPICVRVAATLRVADHIASGMCTAEQMAKAITEDEEVLTMLAGRAMAVDEPALEALLAHLAERGVLAVDPAGRYSLTSIGHELRDDHPHQVRRWLDMRYSLGEAELTLVRLLDTVLTGQTAFESVHGLTFWQALADPASARHFAGLMSHAQRASDAPAVISAHDWRAVRRVMDVGGGDGTLLVELLTARPALRGTLFERPGPIADAARVGMMEAGLGDRAEVVTGDFLADELPTGADVIVLAKVLRDWGDRDARYILERCAAALGTGGRILVIEGQPRWMRTEMAVRLVGIFGGRERSLAQLTDLATDAGLAVASSTSTPVRTIVELARVDP